jgi:glycosyltransferase involved in cell wall biosynthesis
MRVLMFGWEYPPYATGGLATATLSLASGLARFGSEVTLVVPFPADMGAAGQRGVRVLSASEVVSSLRLVRVASPLVPYTPASTTVFGAASARVVRELTPYRHSLFEDVDAYASVAARLAATYPHDVIHAHDWMAYPAGRAARAMSGKPFVAHIHATEFDRSGDWPNDEIRGREREGLLAADRIIANSRATKRRIVERYGIPEDRVDVVHWGIDLAEHAEARGVSPFGPDVPVVVFLGRVVLQKGPDYFVEAAARVASKRGDVCFVVAGAGDMLPAMLDRCVQLGIAHRTFFTGGISREDAERLYRFATVCVMPSVSEPFGLVALESLRAGTPVIISKRAGVAEAVANLITVDFWDVDDIADKILAVVNDDTLATELRARAREELADPRRGPDEPARLTLESYRLAIDSRD